MKVLPLIPESCRSGAAGRGHKRGAARGTGGGGARGGTQFTCFPGTTGTTVQNLT